MRIEDKRKGEIVNFLKRWKTVDLGVVSPMSPPLPTHPLPIRCCEGPDGRRLTFEYFTVTRRDGNAVFNDQRVSPEGFRLRFVDEQPGHDRSIDPVLLQTTASVT